MYKKNKLVINKSAYFFNSTEGQYLASEDSLIKLSKNNTSKLIKDILNIIENNSVNNVDEIFSLLDSQLYQNAKIITNVLLDQNIIGFNTNDILQNDHNFIGCGDLLDKLVQNNKSHQVSNIVEMSNLSIVQHLNSLDQLITPVLVFEKYNLDELKFLNKYFLNKKQKWILILRLGHLIYFMAIDPYLTNCFECLPLNKRENKIIQDIPLSSKLDDLDLNIISNFTLKILSDNSWKNKLEMNLVEFNLIKYSTSLISRIKQPRCIACGVTNE